MVRDGIFPDELKKAKVCPLYKQKGARNEVKNYRPISLLPTTDKNNRKSSECYHHELL